MTKNAGVANKFEGGMPERGKIKEDEIGGGGVAKKN